MAIRLQANQIQNLQQMDAVVSGPDGANRLFSVTGQCAVGGLLSVFSSGTFATNTQTFTVLLGPVFTRQQFFRAICTASIAQTNQHIQIAPGDFRFEVLSSDADWDDESGQVELRIETSLTASGSGNSAAINSLSFHVTILAAVAA